MVGNRLSIPYKKADAKLQYLKSYEIDTAKNAIIYDCQFVVMATVAVLATVADFSIKLVQNSPISCSRQTLDILHSFTWYMYSYHAIRIL